MLASGRLCRAARISVGNAKRCMRWSADIEAHIFMILKGVLEGCHVPVVPHEQQYLQTMLNVSIHGSGPQAGALLVQMEQKG